MPSEAKLGADRTVRLTKRIEERYSAMVELLVDEYEADGRPPFTEPLTPFQQYQQLLAARGAGSAQFFDDPEAQARLAELEARFGPAPALAGPGYMPGGMA